ncbi:MAG: FxsA family protein [Paraglaciecola sp.]|uniref:FxsA family protein n=1 Tax=Paraglaciecola sp. TaxID=1920173 RepID=UPI00273EDBAE|nr:FxsA family protein [Paraglaciecola sp.]MDP5032605.1 FxsA family protein [Paraglaciecola sp.]MDP5134022.1 FxsA family protein [Paraglaciecola sp.]
MGKLFLLFAILPILEITLLIHVGEIIGGWNTVAIVIITAFLGAHLVRQQGLHTLMTAQQKMQGGTLPGQEMAEGLLLVIAGVMLVTPGFITDIFGIVLCLPLTRPLIAKAMLTRLVVRVVQNGSAQTNYSHSQTEYTSRSSNGGDIIEGEYETKDESIKQGLRKPD